ncbi:lipid II flippase family protein [Peribacillus kribbensis]|uniref:lipid II flippase family protein n=1 Tax=Peribacillus kribbensis TaxID=356658 RepID=UPI002480E574|nr:DUF2837 family protein [Peribacillus kribbensis]
MDGYICNWLGLWIQLFTCNPLIFERTGVYTAGVLASLYASILNPENKAAAIMSSGIIN